MRFTKEQQSAILAENREVLVSAAAGSGKTAVLVERILHLIADEGYSIDRMLIVTYTRAAAAELRERLETRIQEAALAEPRLAKQAELVSGAQISTIHAYCQKVLREQFRFCQLDPQFTMGDERTMQAMYSESMEAALDRFYTLAKEQHQAAALAAKLPERKLAAAADTLYRFLMSRPDPEGWLEAQANKHWELETLDEEPAAAAFNQEAALILQGALEDWSRGKAMLESPAFPKPLEATIDADLDTLNMLIEASREGLTTLSYALNQCRFITIARVKPVTSDEAAAVEDFKTLRDKYKKAVQSMRELLPGNMEAAIEDMNAMGPALQGLALFMGLLMEEYRGRKLEQAVLDFDDLEHMTLDVLRDEELQQVESDRFDALFVDEYQDVSAIQEELLNRLKRKPGQGKKQYVFYVGDVKQSIYRFRLAEPKLFLEKMETFSQEEDAEKRKIILNKNFRSRVAVLDAVNRTFLHVMDSRVTEIDYDRQAMLYPGSPSTGDPEPELHMLTGESYLAKDMPLAEAELIAGDILATVGCPVFDGEGNPGGALHYRDIAILMPAVKGIGEKVEAVLAKAGIPVYVDAAVNALGGDEVIQAVQHLTLLDNPMNDTVLIAELRSPLFEMTEEELCRIRLEKPEREASFWDALQHTAEHRKGDGLGLRCQRVLDFLEEERFLYRSMTASAYLWSFLSRSGLYAYYGAQPGGKLRQANLRMLCQKAEAYAQAHKEGLQGFLESVSEKTGGDGSSPTVVNPWEDVVRIMTIHKSKGLEFPTVYLMGMGTTLSRRRQTKTISLHGTLGLGLMYCNEQARTMRTTFLQSAIQLRLSAEERAEKARVLYVAMTRAKSRLVMVGSYKSEKRGLESPWKTMSLKPNEYNDLSGVRTAATYLDWLRQSLLPTDLAMDNDLSTKPIWKIENETIGKFLPTFFPQKTDIWRVFFHIAQEKSRDSHSGRIVNNEFLGSCKAYIDNSSKSPKSEDCIFNVPTDDPLAPCPAYSHLPLKLGVTALCRALEETDSSTASDGEDGEETVAEKRMPLLTQRPRLMSALAEMPAFLRPEEGNLAVRRGSVTHRLLELIALEGAREALSAGNIDVYIKEEIGRLVQAGILLREEADLMDTASAAVFFRSALGKRMLGATVVHREWSFTMRIREPLDTLAQGVIDLCFLENDKWVLVDFKTDRVRETKALWERYGRQLGFYREALEKATAYPVGEMGLYSLALNEASLLHVEPKI